MTSSGGSGALRSMRKRAWSTKALAAGSATLLVATLGAVASSGTAQAAPVAAPPTCQPGASGAVFVTATCVDPDPSLQSPVIDTDEWQTTTDPASHVTVHYRYIHGQFAGGQVKFAFYFPSKEQYEGRFFESTYPTVSQEGADPSTIAFAISNGAYVVSSNNAGGVPAGGAIAGYRANAAAAKYSRVVAQQVYGTSARPRGYLYGASGGAYQTVGAAENTSGVWDGTVPMVFGVPNAIPSFQAVQMLGLRVLGDKLAQIADAMAPGGSGNPYAGLTPEQQSVLREITRMGFPLRGWWQYKALSGGSFDVVALTVEAIDPTYVTDFWGTPGYEGNDDPLMKAARVQYAAAVTSLVRDSGGATTGLVLSSVPTTGDLAGAELEITSGAAAGKSVELGSVSGNTVTFGFGANPAVTGAIQPGDQLTIDNSWTIALEYYQRHQVPPASAGEYGWDQYRGSDGQPLEPQRPLLIGPLLAASAGGAVPTGHFYGKMIMLGSVMDVQAYPWSEDWYRTQAKTFLGKDLNEQFRLWYMDNADHDPNGPAASPEADAAAHIVSYTGELQQALLDLDAWVKKGARPSASTAYTVDYNDQVHVPAVAGARKGIQPAVSLWAKAWGAPVSSQRIDVKAGQPVTFWVKAQTPPQAGKIVRAQWDFQGLGTYPVTVNVRHPSQAVRLSATYTFTEPGTYFPVIRVMSQRQGNTQTPWDLIQNLDSLRVVVH